MEKSFYRHLSLKLKNDHSTDQIKIIFYIVFFGIKLIVKKLTIKEKVKPK